MLRRIPACSRSERRGCIAASAVDNWDDPRLGQRDGHAAFFRLPSMIGKGSGSGSASLISGQKPASRVHRGLCRSAEAACVS
jgi:hypothetical protein